MSKKTYVKVEIPRTLQMAIVKLQAAEDLDFDEACARAAQLLSINSSEFSKAVDVKVSAVKRGLFLGEVNRARKTWTDKGYEKGYSEGEAAGYRRGVDENRILFPCAVCDQPLWVPPDSEAHGAVIGFLKENGWAHAECHGKA